MRSGGCGFAAAVWGVIYGSEREACGNSDTREWLSDLRELAMNNIQQEQQQAMAVMQTVHTAAQNDPLNRVQPYYAQQQNPGWRPGYQGMPQQGFAQPQQQGDGGFFSEFINSGFGRAIEIGAGFGIGDDLINKLF